MSTSVSAVSTVTEERKHELLMEARSSRLSWVQNSSPYQIDDDPQLTDATATKTNQRAMSILNSTNVARKIPSSIPVLEKLLEGKPIEELQDLTKPWRQKMLVKQHEQQSERLVHVLDDHAFVFCYEQILERLCMPESIVSKLCNFAQCSLQVDNLTWILHVVNLIGYSSGYATLRKIIS